MQGQSSICAIIYWRRRPPLLTDYGWGPLLPLGYLERQQFRPLPRCSLIGPLRTSAHPNFTIAWTVHWASRENLCVRATQHRLPRSISAVSCWFFFYCPIPLHLQIAIGRVNHTRRDKEEQTVEKMAGTNGRWLRPAYWVIGFEPLILSDLFWIKAIKCPHIQRG